MQRLNLVCRHARSASLHHQRKGSVLILVIALLGMLLLLGIAFYTYASQEQLSAGFFSESAKKRLPGISAETYFNGALEQLIVGPASNQFQSALWGRRHSLIGNMLGINYKTLVDGAFDSTPYNGRGAHIGLDPTTGGQYIDNSYNAPLTADTTGMFGVKLYLNGAPSPSFGLNLSHGSQYADREGQQYPVPATDFTFINDTNIWNAPNAPQPDVDYTYPDINNPFLAYIREASEDPNGNRIIIPSFHLPQYLRYQMNSTDQGGTAMIKTEGRPIPNWQYDPNTIRKVLSPHVRHQVVTKPATLASPLQGVYTGLTRFLPFGFDGAPGVAGVDDNGDTVVDDLGELAWPGSDDFPFRRPCGQDGKPGIAGLDDDAANGVDDLGELGAVGSDDFDHQQSGPWSLPLTSTSPHVYQYDVDNDGDGIKEGVWLDLDFPIQSLIDGRKFVPLVSFTVLDADGLINLNTAGNLNGFDESPAAYLDAFSELTRTTPIHSSNLGVSRAEVNPLWGLTHWSPGNLPDPGKFKLFSNTAGSLSRTAVANMELFHLKNGQKYDDGAGGDLFNDGQWGELDQLEAGYFPAPGRLSINVNNDADFTDAGDVNGDDDQDSFPIATGHPLDLRGFGISSSPGIFGNTVDRLKISTTNPDAWPRYWSYIENSDLQIYGSNLLTPLTVPVSVNANQPSVLREEPDESVVEPTLTGTSTAAGLAMENDNVYGTDEMFFLHTTNSEFSGAAANSRLQKLLPINFGNRDIRSQFTTSSFDRAEIGWPISQKREWEFDPATRTLLPFTNDPFRPAVRALLDSDQKFKLQLNALLTGLDGNNRPIFKALMAHPSDYSQVGAAAQEVTAIADRQALAQDIYTLLYCLGAGVDTDLTTTTTSPYNAMQIREMAQFAVNVVDAMDVDEVITRFEFDDNPQDGWTNGSGKFVFGVEAQSLTFSEWLGVRLEQADSGAGQSNHPATRQDDTTTPVIGDYWSYIELRNAGPYPVDLTNWGWRIRKVGIGGDRRLTLRGRSGTPLPSESIPAGGQYVIGSTTRLEPFTTGDNKFYASDFRIDYDLDASKSYNRIFPRNIETVNGNIPNETTERDVDTASNLDLVQDYTALDVPDGNGADDRFIVSDSADSPLGIGEFFKPTSLPDGTTEQVTLLLERRMNLDKAPPTNKASEDPDNPWVVVDMMIVEPAKAVQLIDLDMSNSMNDTESTLRGLPTSPGTLRAVTSRERAEPLRCRIPGDTNSADAEQDAYTAIGVTPNIGGTTGNLDFEPTCTLGYQNNSNAPQVYRLWQPHFDREFTSTYELLSIPLYGPCLDSELNFNTIITGVPDTSGTAPNSLDKLANNVTGRLAYSLATGNSLNTVTVPTPSGNDYKGAELVAANKFLHPDFANDANVAEANYDNRWYRILDLFEVPTRTNWTVQWAFSGNQGTRYANPSIPPRLPGAINLNTVRNRASLLALLDDPDDPLTNSASELIEGHFPSITQANGSPNSYPNGQIPDMYEGRDWWHQFVGTRDRRDVVSGLSLPGLPGSSPYRSNLFLDDGNDSVQRTVLRGLSNVAGVYPANYPTVGITSDRNLFEARTIDDLTANSSLDTEDINNNGILDTEDLNGNGRLDSGEDTNSNGMLDTEDLNRNGIIDTEDANGNSILDPGEDLANRVDYHTRHRLLRKLGNNSTTRSNVFIVWVSVKFFRAIDTGEDLNGNGILNFSVEDVNENGILDPGEDRNGNGILDVEDVNKNGILDMGEDLNGNGILDGNEAFLGNGLGGGSPDTDGVRIGGALSGDDQPEHRGFFIVDRSLLENAFVDSWTEDVNGNDVLDPGEDGNGDGKIDSGTRFDYKKFIMYRKTLK